MRRVGGDGYYGHDSKLRYGLGDAGKFHVSDIHSDRLRGPVIGEKGHMGKAMRDELPPRGIDIRTFGRNTEDDRVPRFVRTCVSVRRESEL